MKVKTVGAIVALAFAIFAPPADAQQAGKVFRIGWLGLASPGPEVLRIVDAFPGHAAHPLMLREAEVAARSLGVQPQRIVARGPDEFEGAFAAMTREGAGALVVFPDPVTFLHRTRLAELGARYRLPAVYGLTEHVEVGGLMAYSGNFADLARRAATYVDQILKGAEPADLPVQQPTTKALGLTIPQSILIRADHVIQ